MNRKLIRPNLADVKGKERESPNPKDQRASNNGATFVRRPQFSNSAPSSSSSSSSSSSAPTPARISNPTPNNEDSNHAKSAQAASTPGAASENAANNAAKNRRVPPPVETNAEIFYYKKQIDSHTLMVIVLTDNEEVEGTIEWYDRHALKVNRVNAPNIMLLKHNIKYMFKADERENTSDDL